MNTLTHTPSFTELSDHELSSTDGGMVISATLCVALFVAGYMIGEDI